MTHEPNTESVRRILYMHGIVSAVMFTDQKTSAVGLVLEQPCAEKSAVASELKDWCGFQFAVYDAVDAGQPEYQAIMRDGERFSVSPGA